MREEWQAEREKIIGRENDEKRVREIERISEKEESFSISTVFPLNSLSFLSFSPHYLSNISIIQNYSKWNDPLLNFPTNWIIK